MNIARLFASGLGIGFAPFAPGTAGSLLGLAIGAGLLHWSHEADLLGVVVASLIGVLAISRIGGEDEGWIVIDEIAGQMIAVLALPRVTFAGLVLAFLLFRFFDVTKLGPIGVLDRRHDAWGIMGDDWLAGVCALIVLAILFLLFPVS